MRRALILGFLVLGIALISATHAKSEDLGLVGRTQRSRALRQSRELHGEHFLLRDRFSVDRTHGETLPDSAGTNRRETCLYFDRRWFHADDEARFYPVNVTITEFGPSFRLYRAVEPEPVGWLDELQQQTWRDQPGI